MRRAEATLESEERRANGNRDSSADRRGWQDREETTTTASSTSVGMAGRLDESELSAGGLRSEGKARSGMSTRGSSRCSNKGNVGRAAPLHDSDGCSPPSSDLSPTTSDDSVASTLSISSAQSVANSTDRGCASLLGCQRRSPKSKEREEGRVAKRRTTRDLKARQRKREEEEEKEENDGESMGICGKLADACPCCCWCCCCGWKCISLIFSLLYRTFSAFPSFCKRRPTQLPTGNLPTGHPSSPPITRTTAEPMASLSSASAASLSTVAEPANASSSVSPPSAAVSRSCSASGSKTRKGGEEKGSGRGGVYWLLFVLLPGAAALLFALRDSAQFSAVGKAVGLSLLGFFITLRLIPKLRVQLRLKGLWGRDLNKLTMTAATATQPKPSSGEDTERHQIATPLQLPSPSPSSSSVLSAGGGGGGDRTPGTWIKHRRIKRVESAEEEWRKPARGYSSYSSSLSSSSILMEGGVGGPAVPIGEATNGSSAEQDSSERVRGEMKKPVFDESQM